MSSASKNKSKISLKRIPNTTTRTSSSRTRRITTSQQIRIRRRRRARASCCSKASPRTCSKVSDKLEALKNLIPSSNGDIVKADQLFQETANYILRLRTQVFVLQRLIHFYGSNEPADNNSNSNITNNVVL